MKSSKLPGMLSVQSKKGLDYMDMILKTTDLCKNFKGQMAVNNVSLNMLPIYLIHLFVGMSFGKGASMGLGIAGSLIAALMITGLGDATWKYIPWAWGVRAMDYTVLAWDSPQLYVQVKTDFFSGMIISVCCTVCLLIASLVWFHGWEGGKNSE